METNQETNQTIDNLVLSIVKILVIGGETKRNRIAKLYELKFDASVSSTLVSREIKNYFLSAILSKSLNSFIEAQYLIDVSLKIASIELFNLFHKDQEKIQSDFQKVLLQTNKPYAN